MPIPKKSGGGGCLASRRIDRIAQTAVKMWPSRILIRSSTRFLRLWAGEIGAGGDRCHQTPLLGPRLVVEFDIRGLFDNLDHGLLMTALRKHCQEPWILLYVERWLKAPMQNTEGQLQARDKGTPQGGVVSPILANLFLHYAFDLWVTRHLPGIRFARYADDAVLHCKSRRQAESCLIASGSGSKPAISNFIRARHRIVYCKDINRTEANPDIQFTFLGYTFRPRKAVDKYGRVYVNFSPAVSRDALKAMRQTIRGWRVQLKNDKSVADLSAMPGPILRGWQQYYGHFHGSALKSVWRRVNRSLIGWLMRKHKKVAGHKTRAAETLKRLAQRQPRAFVHWSMGYLS